MFLSGLRPGCSWAASRLHLRPAQLHSVHFRRSMAIQSSTRPDDSDAFITASRRLQTLLTDASLGNKDTVPMDHLDACSPAERLTVFTNLGSLTMLVAIALCWIFGEDDPLGGIRLSSDTLDAALAGVVYAVPLVLCSLAGRSKPFREAFPVLEEMHESQQELAKHFTAGMNLPQMCILLAALVLPSLMLLLPATQAGIIWASNFMQQVLLQPWGSVLHVKHADLGLLREVLPPVISGWVAGLCAACCFSIRPKEIELVRDGVKSADKYFCVTSQAQAGPRARSSLLDLPGDTPTSVFAASSMPGGQVADLEEVDERGGQQAACGQAAADAFKVIAMVWLLSKRRVARLSYVLSALDVAYLGVIWQATSNLATPAISAFLLAAAECWLGDQQEQEKNMHKVKVPVLVKAHHHQGAQDRRR